MASMISNMCCHLSEGRVKTNHNWNLDHCIEGINLTIIFEDIMFFFCKRKNKTTIIIIYRFFSFAPHPYVWKFFIEVSNFFCHAKSQKKNNKEKELIGDSMSSRFTSQTLKCELKKTMNYSHNYRLLIDNIYLCFINVNLTLG